MKKLKIFLLLSILLCFGFALSSEVHAQDDGPKIFEVGDVLPAEIIKMHVSLYNSGAFNEPYTDVFFGGSNKIRFDGSEDDGYDVTPYVYIITNLSPNYVILDDSNSYYEGSRYEDMYAEIIIDFSNCSLSERTVTSIKVSSNHGGINPTWEVVPTGPKIFEVGDILPAGNIKISWDFTDITFGEDDELWIYLDNIDNPSIAEYIHVYKVVLEYETIILDMYDKEVHADTTGNIIITLTNSYIVDSIQGVGDLPYEYINEALTWEVVSQDYTDGYEDGYADAGVSYGLGYEHAREAYGYYDPLTDQWLSVNEYLNLYGTDKLGQSDFYNNFDKYFIPAMIIVFGGAIVLTILKVFKGRE